MPFKVIMRNVQTRVTYKSNVLVAIKNSLFKETLDLYAKIIFN
jgi:hypothetical protein